MNNLFLDKYCALILVCACMLVGTTTAADPRFEPQTIDNRVQIGYGLVIGHVDGDRRPDILLADKQEIVWYQNPGSAQADWPRHVMARNLTDRDNVCLAARDLDGDGLVEVAVGANWNPGETSDVAASGALFYLHRPQDPRQLWPSTPIASHDPTTHRMHWLRFGPNDFRLTVLPLHGRGNQDGQGRAVRVAVYRFSGGHMDESPLYLDESMHMTHNFDPLPAADSQPESFLLAGREGIKRVHTDRAADQIIENPPSRGAGEVRAVQVTDHVEIAAIEPMHGTDVAFYQRRSDATTDRPAWHRQVLDNSLQQGHALAAGDLLRLGRDQIVAGWRSPNSNNKVGIRLYVPDQGAETWTTFVIDDNQMACEDIRLADLDGDGRIDIVAAGRATNNLIVYWNR